MLEAIDRLKADVQAIKARNRRVEADKAWETSKTRRIFVAVSTYLLISVVLYSLKVPDPLLNAIMPSIAYIISTTSLSIFKNWWLAKRKQ